LVIFDTFDFLDFNILAFLLNSNISEFANNKSRLEPSDYGNIARKLDEIVHFMEHRNAREQAQTDKMEKKLFSQVLLRNIINRLVHVIIE
jgi:hypothetical protein